PCRSGRPRRRTGARPAPPRAATATRAPTPTPSPRVTAPPIPAGNSIRLEPYYSGVVSGGGFTVRVVQRATVATSGITLSIVFDKALVQVVSITKLAAFSAPPISHAAPAPALAAP